jgi:hypothetical protein
MHRKPPSPTPRHATRQASPPSAQEQIFTAEGSPPPGLVGAAPPDDEVVEHPATPSRESLLKPL